MIGTRLKEAILSAKERVIQIAKAKVSPEKLECDKNTERLEQPKAEIANDPLVEPSGAEPIFAPQECDPPPSNVSDTSGSFTSPPEIQVSREMATECLTCENLIHCDIRSSSSDRLSRKAQNGASCRLATKLSSK
jgi:hypothetical protein